MKIGVTGPKGRLGSEFLRWGCVPIDCDVTAGSAVNKAILETNPDVIIHCAAKTNVDMCEVSPINTARVNMGGTFFLAEVFSGPIVYISTDYVFDGKSGPYTENDKPCPVSVYGWSKLGGEIVLKNRENPDDLIIRTTVLFDKSDNNFVTNITRKLLNGEMIYLPPIFGSPTYVPHLAEAIMAAIKQNVSGVLNLTGNRVMSRFELGRHIIRKLRRNIDLVRRGQVTGIAPRPLKAGLVTTKAEALGLPIYDPYEGVREVLDALEKVAAG